MFYSFKFELWIINQYVLRSLGIDSTESVTGVARVSLPRMYVAI